MNALNSLLRRQLERVIRQARDLAEEAAADAIRRMAIADPDVPSWMQEEQRALRRRLRAHARSLGDAFSNRRRLETKHLQEAAAYEFWHRMLFARFLVERGLLIHPQLGAALTLDDLADLAPEEEAADAWSLAERYAAATLPAVFKPEDPVLALPLDPHHHKRLQSLVLDLDATIFEADDALGWTYQFWRAAEKEAVNAAGAKIGARELPAVTQLFTEPYMVKFLLHNTFGAWWAGKTLAGHPHAARNAANEAELRTLCHLPGITWEFLRFVRDPDQNNVWRPAAGTYDEWPAIAKDITFLDPCCGSGHFLVEALAILVALRTAEEGLKADDAVRAVLQENLHGLEIDGRCVQIAAFAVALKGWRIAGAPVPLPNPQIAWIGAPPPLPRTEMAALADGEPSLRHGLEALHDQFAMAPLLGSLLEISTGDLLDSDWRERQQDALSAIAPKIREEEPERSEGVVAARGLLEAVSVLSRRYTLQVTNVPFLGTRRHGTDLKNSLARMYRDGKADMAGAMLMRCADLAAPGGCFAAVTKHEVFFQDSYKNLRLNWLKKLTLNSLISLGEHGFESDAAAGAFSALIIATNVVAGPRHKISGVDATQPPTPAQKSTILADGQILFLSQSGQEKNIAHRFLFEEAAGEKRSLLSDYCLTYQGIKSGDDPRYIRYFWENAEQQSGWIRLQSTVETTKFYGGASLTVWWGADGKHLIRRREEGQIAARQHRAVSVGQMRQLPASILSASAFDSNVSPIFVKDDTLIPAVFCYCTSDDYRRAVRLLDPSIGANNSALVQVPFDEKYWRRMAAEQLPNGLPDAHSDDPTQWLFHGHPARAERGTELHVALARIIGFKWPAEIDEELPISKAARVLVQDAQKLSRDEDGIVALHADRSEPALADRLRSLLSVAFGPDWSNAKEAELIASSDALLDKRAARDGSLEGWLRDRAFRQHCILFKNRPFIWQIWDGLGDGFSAFLHYHRLDYNLLQKVAYARLGDWLSRARAENDEVRHEKARALQQAIESILAGEKPHDIFVRWKPMSEQPAGWRPDLNDGVRLNIRPFVVAGILRDTPNIKWTKDRGSEAATAHWASIFGQGRINDHHTTLADKQRSREVLDVLIRGVA